MVRVSTREFRANQKKYFDLAENEMVLIQRKNQKPIQISILEDQDLISSAEMLAIKEGINDIKMGRTT